MHMTHKQRVKWQDRDITRTGEIYYNAGGEYHQSSPNYTGIPFLCVLQDAAVLSGDGTREQRLAERATMLAACTEIHDGDEVTVDGVTFTLKLTNHRNLDAFKGVRVEG